MLGCLDDFAVAVRFNTSETLVESSIAKFPSDDLCVIIRYFTLSCKGTNARMIPANPISLLSTQPFAIETNLGKTETLKYTAASVSWRTCLCAGTVTIA